MRVKVSAAVVLAYWPTLLLVGDRGTAAAVPEAVSAEALRGEVEAEVPRGFAGSVLVARLDQRLLDEGFGSEGGFLVRPDTKFWIASTAKQFTSVAILLCREKGLLGLGDRISKFFPSVPKDKRSITIEQLLTHSSGFSQSYVSEGAADRDAAVKAILAEPLVDRPGAKFHYSNNNYQLAAAIIEVVSGQPYPDFVRTRLWGPAGLQNTGFSGDSGARTVAPARSATPARLTRSCWGAEGVYSTTGDLFRWYRFLTSGRVMSAQSFATLMKPRVEISEGRSAFGWFVGENSLGTQFVFTRGNEDFGPNSLLYVYPKEGLLIVVLSHAGSADQGLTWSRLVHAKLERLLHLSAPAAVQGRAGSRSREGPREDGARLLAPLVRALDTTEHLVPYGVKLEVTTHLGRKSVRLLNNPPMGPFTMALVEGTRFRDGTIEIDVAGEPVRGASEAARGFVGVAFRVGPTPEQFDCFYLRPTNARSDDQLRRNHSTQYIAAPDFQFDRLRRESPGLYESYVDLIPGHWTHLRIEIQGQSARLFVNGADQPALVVKGLKRVGQAGLVALWIGDETDAHFSNLQITPAD